MNHSFVFKAHEEVAKLFGELEEVRDLLLETTEQLIEKKLEYGKYMQEAEKSRIRANQREDEDADEINYLKRREAMWEEAFRLVGARCQEYSDQLAQLKAEKK